MSPAVMVGYFNYHPTASLPLLGAFAVLYIITETGSRLKTRFEQQLPRRIGP